MIWPLQAYADVVSNEPGVLLWFDSTSQCVQSFRTAAQVAYNTNPQSIGALHVNKDQLLRT